MRQRPFAIREFLPRWSILALEKLLVGITSRYFATQPVRSLMQYSSAHVRVSRYEDQGNIGREQLRNSGLLAALLPIFVIASSLMHNIGGFCGTVSRGKLQEQLHGMEVLPPIGLRS